MKTYPPATCSAYAALSSATLPAYVSGVFRVRLVVFVLGALVSGAFFVALYEGLSYLFGEEVVKRIGDAGATALLGVLVAVAIGLGIRVAWSRWRAARRERPAGTSAAGEGHASPVVQPRRDEREPQPSRMAAGPGLTRRRADHAAGPGERTVMAVTTDSEPGAGGVSGQRRAAGIYGAIITAAIIAAVGGHLPTMA